MNRGILKAYYIISIMFLLFILLFTAYRLKIAIDGNREEAQKNLEALRISALSVYLAEGDFQSDYFKSSMRERFSATDRLLLLTVYSSREGILYLISRDSRYLAADPQQPRQRPWSGEPEYTLRPIYENRLSLRFSPGIRKDLFIDGIFQDIEKAQVYEVLREIFYILLVYLLIASVFLLFAATVKSSTEHPTGKGVSGLRNDRSTASGGAAAAGLFSPSTGLSWSQHLSPRLESELGRAAGSDQDLSVLLVSSPKVNLDQLAQFVLDAFPLRDLVFEYDAVSAAVILPDKGLDQSLQEAREFLHRASAVSIGLSARNGRLVSSNRLLTEAGRALKQAKANGGGRVVAFRADPDKYRAAIAARGAGSKSR